MIIVWETCWQQETKMLSKISTTSMPFLNYFAEQYTHKPTGTPTWEHKTHVWLNTHLYVMSRCGNIDILNRLFLACKIYLARDKFTTCPMNIHKLSFCAWMLKETFGFGICCHFDKPILLLRLFQQQTYTYKWLKKAKKERKKNLTRKTFFDMKI